MRSRCHSTYTMRASAHTAAYSAQRTVPCTLHVPIRHSFKRPTRPLRARERFAVNLIHIYCSAYATERTYTHALTQFDELNIIHAFPCERTHARARARVYIWWTAARGPRESNGSRMQHMLYIILLTLDSTDVSGTQLATNAKTIVGRVIERARCGLL